MKLLGVSQRRAPPSAAVSSGGMISGERSMWDANKERGTLELRHKEILARIDILNQLNTQAMLIAGCATGVPNLATLRARYTKTARKGRPHQ